MKVCLFTDTLGDLNGVSRFIQDMGEQAHYNSQASEHFDLQIITATQKPIPDKSYIHNLPLRFRVAMPFYQELDIVWPSRKAITQLLLQHQPDKVHISTPGPLGWIAKKEAEKLKIPVVGTYHTDFPAYILDLTHSNWLKKQTDKIMAKFYRPFEHVFSRSDAYLPIMETDIQLKTNQISTLRPGTNLERFNPKHQSNAIWNQFNLSEKRLKVLYVGRINVEKNIPFLLKTWQALMQAHPMLEADLILVGEGRFRKLANQSQDHHVHFLGPIQGQALSKLYASSDIFVFPSITDTLGQVIMEAQASGLGCIVSDIGGPQSLIKHNETGCILKANEQNVWQQTLYNVLTDQNILRLWQSNSRPHIENYDIAHSFQQFCQKHQSSINQG
ncbi:glycosyltransferase family 1 protein [Hydrogenovibrio sp. SC-1]|uniref:glycosyltransferase family 4 protein n=1 Tax=Hydrogenovibrio sp. SC-1 TaxID=2065820 RepID=UPI000C7C51FE|nr:glycosyltransferase family 1 protein [Hydrogenovibrio sp. SC-1]PLA74340.1 glycosyltransferase family 1 protein [Hydrogenovibrio sp. SC-1]